MKKPKIRYVSWGIANTFNNNKERWIELNKNLKRYPRLKKEILKHELKHYWMILGAFRFVKNIGDGFVNLWIVLWSLSMILIWFRKEEKGIGLETIGLIIGLFAMILMSVMTILAAMGLY